MKTPILDKGQLGLLNKGGHSQWNCKTHSLPAARERNANHITPGECTGYALHLNWCRLTDTLPLQTTDQTLKIFSEKNFSKLF